MSEVTQNGDKTGTGEAVIVADEGKSEKDIGGQSATEKNHEDELPAGIKKRFAKLTREKYEASSKYDALKSEFDAFRKSFEQPKEYANKEEEVADLVAKEIARRESEASERKKSEEKVSKYVQKYNESDVSDIEDFEDVVNSVPIDLSNEVDKDIADYIINSDSGKRLTYELCKTPELLETLRQQSYSVRAKTLMKLDDQLYKNISDKKATEIVQNTIDDAADTQVQKKHGVKLITPVTGKTTPKGSGKLTMEEYMEQRNQRLAKKK